MFAGLSLHHDRSDIYRALLESVGFGIRHNIETIRSTGAEIGRVVAIGGGSKNRPWLQFVSDATGIRQELTEETVGAAYGDAFRAGLAVGLVKREDLTQRWVKTSDVVEPIEANRAVYDETYRDFRDLYVATRDIVHRMALRGIEVTNPGAEGEGPTKTAR
jgi:xylulokinase